MSSYPDSPFASGFVEQRLFVRKKVESPLPIELLPGKEVWLHDLGEGGLSVSGSSRLALGTTTFLAFYFPDSNALIEASGVVAWCDSFGRVGVRFTRIKPDSTAALKRWLKSGIPQPSKSLPEAAERLPELPSMLSRAESEIAELKSDLASSVPEENAALKLIAERTLRLTRAAGVAIAWREGEDVICRASIGNAPEIGVKLSLDAGLTGECCRTGNIVSLADSENDRRVDAELCRQLQFRSLLIVPVVLGAEVVGVVEVLSPAAGNFEGGDVLLLSSIAELIAEIYARRQTVISPSIGSVDDLLICELEMGWQEPAHDRTLAEFGVSASQQTVTSESLQDARQVDPPQISDELKEQPSNDEPSRTSWQARSRNYLLLVFFAAVTVASGNYLNWHVALPGVEAKRQPNVTAALEFAPAQAADSDRSLAPERSLTVQSVDLRLSALDTDHVRSAKPAPREQSVRSNFVKGAVVHESAELPPIAPSIPPLSTFALAVDTSYPALARNVAPKAAMPSPASPTELVPGRLLHRVNPVYPEFAKSAGIRGAVVLSGLVGKDGKVKNVRLVSGNGALALEAFRAARQWRYTPYLLNGRPIEVETRIVMDFNAR